MTEKLEFFRSAVFSRAVDFGKEAHTTDERLVADFGLLETANWLQLGTHVHYFTADEAKQTISDSDDILDAWTRLQKLETVHQKSWLMQVLQENVEKPVVNDKRFDFRLSAEGQLLGRLQGMFETVLLLTAENILANDSTYFVGSIGFTDDGEWNVRKNATIRRRWGAQNIASGFSNVLNYWEELQSISSTLKGNIEREKKAVLKRYERQHISPRPDHLKNMETFLAFIDAACNQMLSFRFSLSDRTIHRYFELAGQYAVNGRQETPEFLDDRLRLFEKLVLLVEFAGGREVGEQRDRLWRVFVQADGRPQAANAEAYATENPPRKPTLNQY